MEDFVTFEIAKKLKEKGFSQRSFGEYDMQGACYIEDGRFYKNGCITEVARAYTAPTIYQVLKWLREEKDIDLVISPVFFYDDVLGKMREYGCKVFTPSLNKPEHCGYHEEWEQAALAGIEYVLDNLI